MKLELYYPCLPYAVLQKFGGNKEWYQKYVNPLLQGHNGLDLLATTGKEIRAAHDGVCVANYLDEKAGWTVGLKTLDQRDYKDGAVFFKTIYCHMREQSAVQINQQVKVGNLIGYANSTGLATISHLHFGLKPVYEDEVDRALYNIEQNNGFFGAIDPAPYFNGQYADLAGKELTLIELLKKYIELLKVALSKKP